MLFALNQRSRYVNNIAKFYKVQGPIDWSCMIGP